MQRKDIVPIYDLNDVEEIYKVLSSNPQAEAAFRIMIETGLLLDDTLCLHVREFDPHNQTLCGNYPLTDETTTLLKSITYKASPDRLILLARDQETPLHRTTVAKAVARAANELHLKDVTLLSARKTYFYQYYLKHGLNTTARVRGGSIQALCDYLGIDRNGKPKSRRTESCREKLIVDHAGKARVEDAIAILSNISDRIENPLSPDDFYECLDTDLALIQNVLKKYRD